MRKHWILALAVCLTLTSSGQNFKQEFSQLFSKEDTTAQLKLLQEWELAGPEDAEMFVAWFNYYFNKSKTEVITLNAEGSADAGSGVRVTDTAGTKTVGYIGAQVHFNPGYISKGLQYINKGIGLHPARLDMRFGKAYVLGQMENYEDFVGEIIKTIEYGNTIHQQWLWRDNEKIEDPEDFLLGNIQTYVVQLFDAGDEQLDRMRSIAETVLKYYPGHVESLSNVAITYSLQGNQDKALESLLKAEKIAAEDYIVLSNIAHIYNGKGDTANAIKYYELTFKHGDEEAKETATLKLKELKKKK